MSQMSRVHLLLQTPLIVNPNNWYKGCYQAKIASSKQENRRRGIILATKYWIWSFDGSKRVIWSDEIKIYCLQLDRNKWVWKKPQRVLQDWLLECTLKFGGGLLTMWVCIPGSLSLQWIETLERWVYSCECTLDIWDHYIHWDFCSDPSRSNKWVEWCRS